MPDKVLKVLRRYLLSFSSYRENTGGGNINPPALRGLISRPIGIVSRENVEGQICENSGFIIMQRKHNSPQIWNN